MYIFIKSHFSRSTLRVIEHVPKTKGFGRRKGSKNRWNLDASMHQKFTAKCVVLEAKIQENREKNDSKNHVFFESVFWYRFWIGLGRVSGGFWKRFWSSLAFLGALLSLFFQGFFCQEGPKGSKRRPRRLLGSIPLTPPRGGPPPPPHLCAGISGDRHAL